MSAHASTRPPNRLAHETSPYLLQHAHNPVDWYPWGEEALARARQEGKPILLSIGYSACHWCHVMERESFEDERIAALMNESFVCIKVDREERPDLDEIYMAATVTMNHGQGGWPMTVFLTPDQRPFYAGTYFPPRDAYGRPGFPTLLAHIATRWREDPQGLVRQAANVTEVLREQAGVAPEVAVGTAQIEAAAAQLHADFDRRWGGFGSAPKFPPSQALGLLLRRHARTGDGTALAMVEKTLDAMARGGMYDQVGGGFARYATDDRWLVPHFEKMLYDNAQLARAYLEGYQVTGKPAYRRVAAETLDYVLREMTAPEGGFWSSTDADSEGEEGKFFVFTPRDVAQVLPAEDARRFCAYYDVTEHGNWEGTSILNVPDDLEEVARGLGIAPADLELSLQRSRPLVYEARRKRVPPGLDDKVLTAWNGLMIGALAEGHRVLGDARYLAAAERAAAFVLATHARPDGRLLRTSRAGKAHIDAFLEDYAYLAEGLLDLYEAGAAPHWLAAAARLATLLVQDFASDEGPFWNTAAGAEPLIVRSREGNDGACPSPNAVAASVLARLSFHLDRAAWREAAARAIRAYGKTIARHPRAFCRSLEVADLLLSGPVELAFVAPHDASDLAPLRRAAAAVFVPYRIVAHHTGAGPAPSDQPLLAGKSAIEGRAAAYVCRNFACQAPITDPSALEAALRAPGAAGRGPSLGLHLPGRATAEATAAYGARHGGAGYTILGGTGLTVSRVGFGGYRIDDATVLHRDALARALVGGANLVDTSTNYGDGGSERAVGAVMRQLVQAGKVRRDEIVVVSKIGYVQGENMELAREREGRGRPFPEMVKYAQDCWHCLHPDWLRDQLRRSLDRLGLETLDVCLLHNPEYFLTDAGKRGERKIEKLRETFYARLAGAFGFLEEQVAAGRLSAYGVSSNTMGAAADDPEATSVTRILNAATAAGGPGHHLRVLQLPMNLFETGPLVEANTGPDGGRTALAAASAAGLGVLVNRPLNAIRGERMARLADFTRGKGPRGDLPGLLRAVAALEQEFVETIAPSIQAPPGATPPARYFRWATELDGLADNLSGLPHWQQIEGQMVTPQVAHVLRALDGHLSGETARTWERWRERYVPALEALLAELARGAAGKSQDESDALALRLDPLLPPAHRGHSLSRKALWVLASTPGVTTVLVGMRRPEYVDDALGILAWPPLPDAPAAYRAVAAP